MSSSSTPRRVPDPSRIERLDPEMVRILRSKTGAEKLQMVSDIFEATRRELRASIAAHHPDWSPSDVHQEVARRLANEELTGVDLKAIQRRVVLGEG